MLCVHRCNFCPKCQWFWYKCDSARELFLSIEQNKIKQTFNYSSFMAQVITQQTTRNPLTSPVVETRGGSCCFKQKNQSEEN